MYCKCSVLYCFCIDDVATKHNYVKYVCTVMCVIITMLAEIRMHFSRKP